MQSSARRRTARPSPAKGEPHRGQESLFASHGGKCYAAHFCCTFTFADLINPLHPRSIRLSRSPAAHLHSSSDHPRLDPPSPLAIRQPRLQYHPNAKVLRQATKLCPARGAGLLFVCEGEGQTLPCCCGMSEVAAAFLAFGFGVSRRQQEGKRGCELARVDVQGSRSG